VEPKIHLLDEPLSNFDANLRKEIRFSSRRFHESFGITTHSFGARGTSFVAESIGRANLLDAMAAASRQSPRATRFGSARHAARAGANVLQRARYLGTRSIEYQVLVNGSDLVS